MSLRARHSVFFLLAVLVAVGTSLWCFGMFSGSLDGIGRQEVLLPEVRTIGPSKASAVDPPEADRTAIALATDEVRVEVVDGTGRFLHATVAATKGEKFDIAGRGAVPRDLGPVEIFARGYASASAEIGSRDLRVTLRRACVVAGHVYDAYSGAPVPDLRLELELLGSHEVIATSVSDAQGDFRLENVPAGAYLLHGRKLGYVNLCQGPDAINPGLPLSLIDGDTRIDTPLYPILGAIITFENRTNLTDEVLSAFVVARTIREGSDLPNFMTWVQNSIVSDLKETGLYFVFPFFKIVSHPGVERYLQVQIIIEGDPQPPRQIRLRPVKELMEGVEPHVVAVARQWTTTAVRLDVPVPMNLARGNWPVGGIDLDPGSTSLQLPLGSYWLRPKPVLSLLDKGAWSRQVRIPEQTEIEVAKDHDYGIIRVEKSPSWTAGGCYIFGEGRELWLWHYGEFPKAIYASPGSYTLQVVLPMGSRERSVVWQRGIRVIDSEVLAVSVGG